jgi:transcription initiation factor TFIIB
MIEILTCSTCNTDQTIITDPETGEIICSKCGLVICEKVEDNSHQERRAFSIEEANLRSRTGAPMSLALYDKGLSTIIGRSSKDAKGGILGAATLSRIERLRTWESRINRHEHSERSIKQAFRQLVVLKDKLGLTDTMIEKSAYIFRKACEGRLLRGRTVDGMLAAAVLIVCREMGNPRTMNDIATALAIKRKDVSRNYTVLIFELNIKAPLVDPVKCIVKVANKLNISEKTKYTAINIMADAVRLKITAGKVPMGLAATILYLSCIKTGEYVSQSSIAEASGVTEVTIRNRLKDIRNQLII